MHIAQTHKCLQADEYFWFFVLINPRLSHAILTIINDKFRDRRDIHVYYATTFMEPSQKAIVLQISLGKHYTMIAFSGIVCTGYTTSTLSFIIVTISIISY